MVWFKTEDKRECYFKIEKILFITKIYDDAYGEDKYRIDFEGGGTFYITKKEFEILRRILNLE